MARWVWLVSTLLLGVGACLAPDFELAHLKGTAGSGGSSAVAGKSGTAGKGGAGSSAGTGNAAQGGGGTGASGGTEPAPEGGMPAAAGSEAEGGGAGQPPEILPDGCLLKHGNVNALWIDNFEDMDSYLVMEAGRTGQWFQIIDDSRGPLTPKLKSQQGWGAEFVSSNTSGIGVDLNVYETKICPYDLSMYEGIRIIGYGGSIRVSVTTSESPSCTFAPDCGFYKYVSLTNTVDIAFDQMAQPLGHPYTFDRGLATTIYFTLGDPVSSYWLAQVELY